MWVLEGIFFCKILQSPPRVTLTAHSTTYHVYPNPGVTTKSHITAMSADGGSSGPNYCKDEHDQRFIPGLPIRRNNEDDENDDYDDDNDDDIDPSYDEYMSRILAASVETPRRLPESVIGSKETSKAAPIERRSLSWGKNVTYVRNSAIHRDTDSKGPIRCDLGHNREYEGGEGTIFCLADSANTREYKIGYSLRVEAEDESIYSNRLL